MLEISEIKSSNNKIGQKDGIQLCENFFQKKKKNEVNFGLENIKIIFVNVYMGAKFYQELHALPWNATTMITTC